MFSRISDGFSGKYSLFANDVLVVGCFNSLVNYYKKSLAWTMALGNAEKHEEEFKTLFLEGIRDVKVTQVFFSHSYDA